MHEPYEKHLEVVHQIPRYLNSTPRKELSFGKNNLRKIEAFIDIDLTGFVRDRRSTSGNCTFMGQPSNLEE